MIMMKHGKDESTLFSKMTYIFYDINGLEYKFINSYRSGVILIYLDGYKLAQAYQHNEILCLTEEQIFQQSLLDEWLLPTLQFIKDEKELYGEL